MHGGDLLVRSWEATNSIACVGLDPRPDLIPPSVAKAACAQTTDPATQVAIAFQHFVLSILEAVAGHCAVVKFQSACYEAYGWRGWQVLEKGVARAQQLGIPVIVDAKRSDIGSSAIHYRQGLLTSSPGLFPVDLSAKDGPNAKDQPNPKEHPNAKTQPPGKQIIGLNADWMTVNPYLGADSVASMLGSPEEGKGVFVLVRTSNDGAKDFQDLQVGHASPPKSNNQDEKRQNVASELGPVRCSPPKLNNQDEERAEDFRSQQIGHASLASVVAERVSEWGEGRVGECEFSDVGAVVGANQPDQARELRAKMRRTIFLVPGFGAQGADASMAVAGCTSQGNGIVVNSSRAILGAWRTEQGRDDFASAAREALDKMNSQLNSALP